MTFDRAEASDRTTLSEVLEHYTNGGFGGSFSVIEGARLLCNACNEESAASDVDMDSLRRLEGASDPDDMMAVVALTCPRCGTAGTVVLGYGPIASAEDSDVLRALRDRRAESGTSGNSAPGEAAGDASPPNPGRSQM